MAFPNFPIVAKDLGDNVARFTFRLLDPPDTWSQPFSLMLDVTAINHGLQIGPSTTVLVSSP